VSPAESNLVKPFEVKIGWEYYWWQGVDGKGGNTTWPVDIPAFFRLANDRPKPKIKEYPFAPGGHR
jgi:hypothetical protein